MVRRLLFSAILLLGLSAACPAEAPDPTQVYRDALIAELPRFDAPGWAPLPPPTGTSKGLLNPVGPALERFRTKLKAWGDWQSVGVNHEAGYIEMRGKSGHKFLLGINIFLPKGPVKGTFLMLHGYLGYSIVFSATMEYFASQGYAVTCMDLPGHGMSTGARADIADFADYGDAVAAWLGWMEDQPALPRPWILTAHSMGSSAVLEYLRRLKGPVPDQTFLVAPLVHSDWYLPSVAGAWMLGWAFPEFPAVFGFDHYLGGFHFETHWFLSLAAWSARLEASRPLKLPLTVITGDKDQVVDEQWNLAFLKRYLPKARFIVLPGVDHLMMTNRKARGPFSRYLESLISLPGSPGSPP